MRATIERHGDHTVYLPPIKSKCQIICFCLLLTPWFVYKDLFTFSSSVRAIKGHEDVTIRVSDQGGGIPRRKTDLLFEYLYTTAPTPQLLSSCDMPGNFGMGTPAPIAGHGYGLPLSR